MLSLDPSGLSGNSLAVIWSRTERRNGCSLVLPWFTCLRTVVSSTPKSCHLQNKHSDSQKRSLSLTQAVVANSFLKCFLLFQHSPKALSQPLSGTSHLRSEPRLRPTFAEDPPPPPAVQCSLSVIDSNTLRATMVRFYY